MYESPIEAIYEGVQMKFEDEVLKAVQKVEINVDKGELIRALRYDRDQYDHGYSDGWHAKAESIVRCKDCKWFRIDNKELWCGHTDGLRIEDFAFCSDGERREDV